MCVVWVVCACVTQCDNRQFGEILFGMRQQSDIEEGLSKLTQQRRQLLGGPIIRPGEEQRRDVVRVDETWHVRRYPVNVLTPFRLSD